MPDESVFVDTNILVYAHDRDAGNKQAAAKEALESLWNRAAPPSISVQVLQEFHVTLVKKGVPLATSRRTVENYLAWNVIESTRSLFARGMDEQAKWQLSFWDGAILAAARLAGARFLWSEDFNIGQDYGGVIAVNPLL